MDNFLSELMFCKNCLNCDDCLECNDCKSCSNVKHSINCAECYNCKSVNTCFNMVNCLNCKRCLMLNNSNSCKDCMFSFNIKACICCGHPEMENNIDRWLNNKAGIKGLDKRIEETYAANSRATNKNALYDSYIKAFRWASDRIGSEGIIAFITNAGWIEGNSMEGFRKSLSTEFDKIYICNLRGNARTSGELRRKEKGNVFGSGTRTPVAITFLIKSNLTSRHSCSSSDKLNLEMSLIFFILSSKGVP